MNLRFVWHIFKKDARRLWWVIALTLALLGRLTHFDSLRAYDTPGLEEGWLNLLLPLSWCLLIALACLEDPVVGETPFWMTVPCRWPSLLAAKGLFTAVFIHLPYFAACVFIVQARGFAPFDYPATLFHQQLAVLALTLGALALATLVENATQFTVVAIALLTAAVAPATKLDWTPAEHVREVFVIPIIVLAGLWIAIVQYRYRRTSTARIAGIAGIVIAAVIWWTPRASLYGIQAVMSPPPAGAGMPKVRLSEQPWATDEVKAGVLPLQFDKASVALSVTVSGLRENSRARFFGFGPELVDPTGERYQTLITNGPRDALPCCANLRPFWQILAIDPATWQRIKDLSVKVTGKLLVDYYRKPEPVVTSVGKTVKVEGVGLCSSDIPPRDNPVEESLYVKCESPNRIPPVQIKLSESGGSREWELYLASAHAVISYPSVTWLSPVNRAGIYFQLTDEEHYLPVNARWQAPREVVESARISVIPEIPEGSQIISYEIPDIRPSRYAVKP